MLLRYVSPDAIWVAIAASVVLYFLDMQWAHLVLFGYLLALAPRGKAFWSAFATLAVFTALGFHAAHRFDWEKAGDWFIYGFVPVFAVMPLVRLNRQDDGFGKVREAWSLISRKAGLHWIPASIMMGTLVSLLVRDRFSIYGGLFVILCVLLLFPNGRTRFFAGLVMITIHVLLIHFFLGQGLIEIKLEPVSYLSSNWGTMVSPYIVMLALLHGLGIKRIGRSGMF
ncbi:hypothetical protein [Cohnella laeviribosi]|uniref:hypothetical protein n=1 Tax=Cohnella laeviribosi TaxID=380174 RepID=UPI00037A8C49|nr:hypothetical protein [Cohnella laeviribosi]